MSSTYSPDLRIELIGTGDQAGVWGSTTNTNLSTVLESSIAGYTSVSVIASSQALTANYGAADQARYASIALTTTTGANFAVYAPPAPKQYVIYNASSYTATIYNSTVLGNTTAAGTGVAIPAGKVMTIWSDGTNFAQQNTHLISPTLASPTLTTPALGTPSSGTLTSCTGLPISTGVAGLGTGVATALAVNVGSAGAPVVNGGVLGTPSSGTLTNATGLPLTTGVTGILPIANGGVGTSSFTGTGSNVFSNTPTLVTPVLGTPTSGTLTNCTGLPVATGISGLGSGVATFLATPSSANLAAAVTGETGSGALVFATSPALVTPDLGTPSAATLTNATGLPVATGISGLGTGVATFLATPSSANLAAAVTGETGSGALVFATSPALTTPDLGTPSAATLTNATGLPIVAGTTGTLSVARGGTGVTTSTGTGNVVFSNSPTLVTPALGTPASGTLTNCTFPTLNQNTTGSAGSLATTSFSVVESGGKLVFRYGATDIASLDSTGIFTTLSDITAGGTP